MQIQEQKTVRAAASDALQPHVTKARDSKLNAACQNFEGLLLGFILKQGLNSGLDDEEDAGNTAMLTDFAAEQTARELGRAETLGIGKMLYEQLSGMQTQPVSPAPTAGQAP